MHTHPLIYERILKHLNIKAILKYFNFNINSFNYNETYFHWKVAFPTIYLLLSNIKITLFLKIKSADLSAICYS